MLESFDAGLSLSGVGAMTGLLAETAIIFSILLPAIQGESLYAIWPLELRHLYVCPYAEAT